MSLGRRQFLSHSLMAGAAGQAFGSAKNSTAFKLGIPGLYPGRVVSVQHPGGIVSGRYQRGAVRDMVRKGMMELTGAPSSTDAWRVFFQRGDVVGIKLNPVGQPCVISAPEVLQEIVSGLNEAGIPNKDIVAYDRYRDQFLSAGFHKWLPAGVRWTWATSNGGDPLQLDMEGYDPDHYMEMALVLPKANPRNAHHRRSYVARFLTRDVSKMVNLCVLKHHQSAGVTLAMKNMSHGLVNNVNRSHSTSSLNACGMFIPAVVEVPVIRQKVALNVLDGIIGAWHGGPGRRTGKYMWEHKTMYFSTDPVAMDRIGWGVIDDKREQMGMEPVALAKADSDSNFVRMQPEHIEIAGALGLGEYEESKIDWKKFSL
jgi:uncharacterized protein (DUF362 family)